MGILKQKFRNIKKFPDWIYWLPARLMWLIVRCCYRVVLIDPNNHVDTAAGVITITWHNRLCFFAAVFPARQRRRTVAVVSPSRDGQYIADFIAQLGIRSLRGSSSKKGARAQLAAIRAIQDGYNVSFTPDGPRGPRYVMKNGPVHLASLTGAPIIPVTVNASRCWSLRSWDRFQIPKPFCRLTVILGDPILIPPDLNPEELELHRRKVEDALLAITRDLEAGAQQMETQGIALKS